MSVKVYEFEHETTGVFHVRPLNMLDMAYLASVAHIANTDKTEEQVKASIEVVARQVCDENGKPIFDDLATAIEYYSGLRSAIFTVYDVACGMVANAEQELADSPPTLRRLA